MTAAPQLTVPDLAALAEPFQLRDLQLPNRLAMAPMTRRFSPDGIPTRAVADYYARRAHLGLLITEGTYLDHPSSGALTSVPRIAGDEVLAGWRRVVEAVHAEGGRIAVQLWHLGLARTDDSPLDPGYPALSPSGINGLGEPHGRAATADDLAELVDAYTRATVAARQVGFDAVEIHGAHGYLLDSFLWAATNQRTDGYGGDAAGRARFPAEVVAAVRAAAGDLPVLYRFSQWKATDYGAQIATTPDELAALLRPLAAAGVDAFHASTRRFWEPAFADSDLTLAGWAKQLTGLPSIAVGSVGITKLFGEPIGNAAGGDPTTRVSDAATRIASGEFDLVAVGRAVLADPTWSARVLAGDIGDLRQYTKETERTLDGVERS